MRGPRLGGPRSKVMGRLEELHYCIEPCVLFSSHQGVREGNWGGFSHRVHMGPGLLQVDPGPWSLVYLVMINSLIYEQVSVSGESFIIIIIIIIFDCNNNS